MVFSSQFWAVAGHLDVQMIDCGCIGQRPYCIGEVIGVTQGYHRKMTLKAVHHYTERIITVILTLIKTIMLLYTN